MPKPSKLNENPECIPTLYANLKVSVLVIAKDGFLYSLLENSLNPIKKSISSLSFSVFLSRSLDFSGFTKVSQTASSQPNKKSFKYCLSLPISLQALLVVDMNPHFLETGGFCISNIIVAEMSCASAQEMWHISCVKATRSRVNETRPSPPSYLLLWWLLLFLRGV